MKVNLKAIQERYEREKRGIYDQCVDVRADRAALLEHIARLQGIISYVRECEGGPALLAEAEAGEPLRQDDMREEVADLQAALVRQSEVVRMLTEAFERYAGHDADCEWERDGRCACGFDAAHDAVLKAAAEGATK